MILDSVARHLERYRLRRRHAVAVARGPVPAADLQAEARRRRDVVARSLDVLGHSCAVEGAQVCLQPLQAYDSCRRSRQLLSDVSIGTASIHNLWAGYEWCLDWQNLAELSFAQLQA